MAQSKSFFGLRRGSTKTLTFSVYNGKQVTKDRVADVKNPRSSMQMRQRAIMATAIHAYSTLSEICDHSFESLSYGQKSMNYFVAENARTIRTAAPNVNLSLFKGNSVSNAYVISKGSLAPITIDVADNEETKVFTTTIGVAASTLTFGELMGALGANVGDMITFVLMVDNRGGNASVYWLRLKLTDKNKSISIATQSSTPLNILTKLSEGADFETNIDNFTAENFPIITNNSGTDTDIYIGEGSPVGSPVSQSLGAILSRKTDTGWLRSSSTMVNMFDTYNYAEALATYPESGQKILNGGNV